MAVCTKCSEPAIFTEPTYCKNHFIKHIEKKVKTTIQNHNLITSNDKIAVAVSGGKDSQTVLHILHTLYKERVHAVAIDEGIPDYRDQTLEDIKQFCTKHNIPLKIYSFKQTFGKKLKEIITPQVAPCRPCGVLRRHLLNSAAKEYDKLATGHNLDDECQSIIMNLLKGNLFLSAKLGPTSGVSKQEGFTQRIKPLYFCTEKEIAAYAFLKKFPVHFTECPHAAKSFRSNVRDAINKIEQHAPTTKEMVVKNFISILPQLKEEFQNKNAPSRCLSCGSPAANSTCKACETIALYAN